MGFSAFLLAIKSNDHKTMGQQNQSAGTRGSCGTKEKSSEGGRAECRRELAWSSYLANVCSLDLVHRE